jgi:hypothetical protein
MSKWVAKKDDVGVGAVPRGTDRPLNGGVNGIVPNGNIAHAGNGENGAGGANGSSAQGRGRAEARRQAGEARRQIRLAAQAAREAVDGPGAGEAETRSGGRQAADEWSSYWAEGWGESDWKQSDWQDEWKKPQDKWQNQDWGWEGAEAWDGEDGSEWDEYVSVKDSTVRVDLSGAELGDADLKELVRHLDGFMKSYVAKTQGHYVLNIDLSSNSYITDDGVAQHLATFLQKWPCCHRLKLFKNAIGDHALKALSSWVADGYVHELHLSDLMGKVTNDGVFNFLKEIHKKAKYPYVNGNRSKCALWLRLEHNGIPNVDDIMKRGQAAGMSLCVLDRADLAKIRPGSTNVRPGTKEVPQVNLVLFRLQERLKGRRGGAAQSAGGEYEELSRPSSPPPGGKSGEKSGDKGWDKGGKAQQLLESPDGGKSKGVGRKDSSRQAQEKTPQEKQQEARIILNELQMGCASYKTNNRPTGNAYGSKGKGKKEIDIGSSAAFPTLGGGSAGFPSLGGSNSLDSSDVWSVPAPNIQAAVAWGAAPSAVFVKQAKLAAAPAPKNGPPPKAPPAGHAALGRGEPASPRCNAQASSPPVAVSCTQG